MRASWARYLAWFDARNSRERAIIACAVIGSILLLGFDQRIWPDLARARQLSLEAARNQQNAGELKAQAAQMQRLLADPDARAKAELEQLQRRLAEQEPRLLGAEATLVPARKMPRFLESLLARGRSLQLLSLKTLPPEPLVAASEEKPAAGSANLYKHGVEIRVSGSYPDLVGYLADLEGAPQKVIWGRMELNAEDYPLSTMDITVYTLSLDKTWLVI